MRFVLKCVFILSVFTGIYGARILGVFIYPTYSHQIVFKSIYTELARRGHEVIVVTAQPLNDPSLTNLTEIDVSYLHKYVEGYVNEIMTVSSYSKIMLNGISTINKFTEEILKNEEFKKIYQNSEVEKFDVVLVEALSAMLPALGHLFNAPSIGIFSFDASLDKYTSLGGIIHPAVYGDFLTDFDYPLSMWQKLQNIYIFFWNKYFVKFINEPAVDQLSKKYFGDDFPSVAELEKNISMIFVIQNKAMHSIRPMPPNIVQLDFIHVQEPKPLPKDLEQVMNNATQGIVYFSFGSSLRSSALPSPITKAIIEGLSSLPYTVLWKWESEEQPDGISDNVITRKWFPQQDVLAHPNVKVFVTQGGMQSCEEAIARTVPVVGIPVIVDQIANINKLTKLGLGVQLSLYSLNSSSLKEAIIEVAENKKYLRRMKEIRDICFDQPMTGLDRAVWWIEYVIRNKGALFLRSALADVPLYEYLLLDVIAIVLVCLITSYYVLKKLVSTIYSLLTNVSQKRKLA